MESRILDALKDRTLELGPVHDGSDTYRNFKLTRDADGVAWLLFDRANASANTLSEEVLTEFDMVLTALEAQRPTGIVIRSAKASGFIAGADINEFRGSDPEAIEAQIARAHAALRR
jgi:3-hydroxyacyl-CoA dehydrogenase/enoyl-CoA hydratase/3-hydroxybutyryl-CoA epimerase